MKIIFQKYYYEKVFLYYFFIFIIINLEKLILLFINKFENFKYNI